jgi:hypothetical protein
MSPVSECLHIPKSQDFGRRSVVNPFIQVRKHLVFHFQYPLHFRLNPIMADVLRTIREKYSRQFSLK